VRPWDTEEEPVPVDIVWRVLVATDVAVLDAFFAGRIRPWPVIAAELMARAVHRAESLAVQRAIASHPRVDMRVAYLLWHLAGRWGKVRADGTVRLDLPLTHRLIGELIGAERPSVSHAVGRLSKAGLVERCLDGWHLSGSPDDHAEAAMRPLPAH
jgi:CRP-like cAMP-binding protein